MERVVAASVSVSKLYLFTFFKLKPRVCDFLACFAGTTRQNAITVRGENV